MTSTSAWESEDELLGGGASVTQDVTEADEEALLQSDGEQEVNLDELGDEDLIEVEIDEEESEFIYDENIAGGAATIAPLEGVIISDDTMYASASEQALVSTGEGQLDTSDLHETEAPAHHSTSMASEDEDSEEDEDEKHKGRFTRERTETSISTMPRQRSDAANSVIPETLEISAEQEKGLQQYTENNQNRNRRASVQAARRGGARGRLPLRGRARAGPTSGPMSARPGRLMRYQQRPSPAVPALFRSQMRATFVNQPQPQQQQMSRPLFNNFQAPNPMFAPQQQMQQQHPVPNILEKASEIIRRQQHINQQQQNVLRQPSPLFPNQQMQQNTARDMDYRPIINQRFMANQKVPQSHMTSSVPLHPAQHTSPPQPLLIQPQTGGTHNSRVQHQAFPQQSHASSTHNTVHVNPHFKGRINIGQQAPPRSRPQSIEEQFGFPSPDQHRPRDKDPLTMFTSSLNRLSSQQQFNSPPGMVPNSHPSNPAMSRSLMSSPPQNNMPIRPLLSHSAPVPRNVRPLLHTPTHKQSTPVLVQLRKVEQTQASAPDVGQPIQTVTGVNQGRVMQSLAPAPRAAMKPPVPVNRQQLLLQQKPPAPVNRQQLLLQQKAKLQQQRLSVQQRIGKKLTARAKANQNPGSVQKVARLAAPVSSKQQGVVTPEQSPAVAAAAKAIKSYEERDLERKKLARAKRFATNKEIVVPKSKSASSVNIGENVTPQPIKVVNKIGNAVKSHSNTMVRPGTGAGTIRKTVSASCILKSEGGGHVKVKQELNTSALQSALRTTAHAHVAVKRQSSGADGEGPSPIKITRTISNQAKNFDIYSDSEALKQKMEEQKRLREEIIRKKEERRLNKAGGAAPQSSSQVQQVKQKQQMMSKPVVGQQPITTLTTPRQQTVTQSQPLNQPKARKMVTMKKSQYLRGLKAAAANQPSLRKVVHTGWTSPVASKPAQSVSTDTTVASGKRKVHLSGLPPTITRVQMGKMAFKFGKYIDIDVNPQKKEAYVVFESPVSAKNFFEKYRRTMVDLTIVKARYGEF